MAIPSFVGTRMSASRAPSGPHTTLLAPFIILYSLYFSNYCKLTVAHKVNITALYFTLLLDLLLVARYGQYRPTHVAVLK